VKITDVAYRGYRWQRARAIRNGRHTYRDGGVGVVEITTDAGLTGLGLAVDPIILEGHDLNRAVVAALRPILAGQDPLDHERIWYEMWQPKLLGRRGLTTRTISAVDIALWDLRGKLLGQPVYKLLGAFEARVPAYIAGGYYEEGKGLAELADEMLANVSLGARAVKMKVGGLDAETDAQRVRAVREAIGPQIKILVDANGAYRAFEAVRFARMIEDLDIYWFEEPVAPDDYDGHALVARSTIIPVATGENEYTRYGFRDLIEHKSAAILNADAQVLGGVTEFMKVAALAQAYDLPIAPHGNQDIHVHLVSAIANGLIVEFYRDTVDPMWGRFLRNHLQLEDGFVSPPDRPGFGIDIDDDAVAEFRVV
jgi:L-alanine-DL-glutamate epimerase-like enolase superfamily enzyme